METLQNNQTNIPAMPEKQEDAAIIEDTEVNVYPTIRHVFLILSILLTLSIIIFLFYQNGKSIYDNGI